ncbi:T9SS type A sorting domain-containing protein [Tenacibaculum sp. MEBiC07804]|uniref:T9SS type A sorting domain-containing protein n=2 Tax=unclassified Tenacibaculum TaxID=2635139 RepID=UPI003BA63FAE
MRKNYFLSLTLLFLMNTVFGQTTLFQESFETGNSGTSSITCNDGSGDFFTRTDGSDIGSFYEVSGQDGSFYFAAMDIDATECGAGNDIQTLTFDDIDISGATNLNLALLLAEDQPSDTNFDWDGGDLFYVEVDYDNSGSFTKVLQFATNAASGFNVSAPMQDTDFDGIGDGQALTAAFSEFIISLGTGNLIDVRLVFDGLGAGDEDIAVDNIRLVDGAITSPPTLAISSPSDNTTFSPETTSVDVALSVNNFNVAAGGAGDGFIKYTVNSGTPTDKFDTTDIALTSLTPGAYAVTAELVDNSGASLNPAVSATVNFTIASYTQVANLAAVRAGTEGDYFEVTGEVILSYNTGNSRNQRYIQDASAGILIDDSAGTITTTYNIYDGITGLKGQLTSFNDVSQFVPAEDPGTASSTGNTITPEVVTLADFEASWDNYESELITIQNVVFTDGGATFAAGQNYEITSGGTTSTFRTNFSSADYIGTTIPSTGVDMTVLGGEFRGDPQVTAIELAGLVLGLKDNNIEGFSVYPNPVEGKTFKITTSSFTTKSVQIFNVLGKKVYTTEVNGLNNDISVPSLNAGIYILKVVEEGKTASKKLLIK